MEYEPTDAQYEAMATLVTERNVIIDRTHGFNNGLYDREDRALICVTQGGNVVVIEPDGTLLVTTLVSVLG